MNKDFEGIVWANAHHNFATWVSDAIETIGLALERLNTYQFDAPWKHDHHPCV